MKISERAEELQLCVKDAMLLASRQIAAAAAERPLSDAEWAEFIDSEDMAPTVQHVGVVSFIGAMARAIDEWQASVEERIARVEDLDARRSYLNAALGLGPHTGAKLVNELAEKAGLTVRAESSEEPATFRRKAVQEAEHIGLIGKRGSLPATVQIDDPGPSKYDREPESVPE